MRVGSYAFAWVGEYEPRSDRVEPREWAGAEKGYLETATFTTDGSPSGQRPTGRAVRTGEPQVTADVLSDPPHEPWREAALKWGYRSSIAIPLTYRDSLYGVLNIYAERPNVFDELERRTLSELGETIAYAINAVESKKALVSDEVTELDVRVGVEGYPLFEFVGADPDRSFELDGIVPADDAFRVFYTVHGATATEIEALAGESMAVRENRLVAERDGDCSFECVVTEEGLTFWLLDRGAVPQSISVSEDGARVTLELARDADARDFVEHLDAAYPEVELLATRRRERSVRARAAFEAALDAELTPRQREVLHTAYLSGYFDTPRERTATDVAASLDISQPTFSGHLRAGLRNVLDLLFTDDLDR